MKGFQTIGFVCEKKTGFFSLGIYKKKYEYENPENEEYSNSECLVMCIF